MFVIKFASANSQYGPYNTKQDALEAKYRISTHGDSLGMKPRQSELKIVEVELFHNPVNNLVKYREVK